MGRPACSASAFNEAASTSSRAAGTTRRWMSCVTASTACVTSANSASSVACAARLRNQPKRDLGDDRERAFGADEQLRQIVADDVLHSFRSGVNDLSAREDRLERQHVALRRPVFERAWTAGAFCDVPAERRLPEARRIRRIEQADLFDRVLQVAGDDVRLDAGEQIELIDLENAIHPLERQHDAAADGHGAAGISGARAARHERHALVIAQLRELRHFLHVDPGQDDEIRGRALPACRRCRSVSRESAS